MRPESEASNKDSDGDLNRLETARGLSISVWEGSLATVFAWLTFNSVFLTGFALMLGATNTEIGILGGLSALSALTQVFCPYVAGRTPSRRWLMVVTAYPGRLLWLLILLIPFLMPTGHARVWVLLGLFTISLSLINFPAPAWTTWMADLVPEEHRGRYFSRRNMIMGVAGMAATLLSGFYKDVIASHLDVHSQAISFATVFLVGVIFSIGGWVSIAHQPEPPQRQDPPIQPIDLLRLPFRRPRFRRLALFFFCWVIAVTIPAPYFAVYMIKTLKLSYSEMNFLSFMVQLGGLAALPLWGYVADKFGNKPVMAICMGVVSLLSWSWLLATALPRYAVLILALNNLLSGLGWYGLALAQFNLVIAVTPQSQKQVYLAAISAVSGIGSFIGPLMGAWILELLGSYRVSLLGLPLWPMELLFILSSLGRVLCLIFGMAAIREPQSQPAGYVIRQMTRSDPVRTFIHLRRARRGPDPDRRAESIHTLGSMRAALAVDDLVAALQDPSAGVRREAARALGHIKDPKAVTALGQALSDRSLGIAAIAAESLGEIGSPEGVPYLKASIDSGHSQTVVSAVRALGRLEAGECAPEIVAVLQRAREEIWPEAAEAACEALSLLGDRQVEPFLLDALGDDEPRIRAAAAQALADRGNESAAAALAEALDKEDEAANLGVFADALAQVGSVQEISALQRALRRSAAPALRRQISRAIGSVIAPGADIYSVLAAPPDERHAQLERVLRGARHSPDSGLLEATGLLDGFAAGHYTAVVSRCEEAISFGETGPVASFIRELSREPAISEEEALLCILAVTTTF